MRWFSANILELGKHMSSFDDREKAQEAKFAHDAQLVFKAEARRNKLLAIWVADLIGKTDVDAYIAEVIASDFEEAGDEDVYRKISGDLNAAGADVSEEAIRAKMAELHSIAKQQVLTEV
jgi:hypothetical protein